MSILVNKDTKVIVQGITGKAAELDYVNLGGDVACMVLATVDLSKHYGGINKCDPVAQGIVEAAKIISEDGKTLPVPVVVRLEGTNVERGREILLETPIKNVIMARTMEGGAEQIVKPVAEGRTQQ